MMRLDCRGSPRVDSQISFSEKVAAILAVKFVKGVYRTVSQMKMDATIKMKQQNENSRIHFNRFLKE